MATAKTVWGIDIGQCALKALKLRSVDNELRLEAFDVIDHPRILTQPEADAELLTRNALQQFLARNNVADSTVVVSAPGKSGITRFVKLPPVEPKQVPEIVRFEAEQQIPFDINEVIWRWQPFRDPDSPDIEVGIFAMKRPDVAAVLDRFSEVEISVDIVQMAPLALYNFLDFDGQTTEEGATLLVDIGADKTDLVVADGPRIWTRTMQRGGNNFTESLVKGFKLSFNKAEKLKRTAATSKYARQIFQAMRPVFAELVQEVQRSIGYYTSLHRDSRFKRVVGLGNGFRLPGLQKYLEQNLNLPVVRVDSYNKLSPSAAVNAPAFTENVLTFAVAYGLALQGLGLTKIQTNLLPSEIARQRLWARKRPWFAGTAAAVLLACAGIAYSGLRDRNTLRPEKSTALTKSGQRIQKYEGLQGAYNTVSGRDKLAEDKARLYIDMTEHNVFWEKLHFIVSQSIGRVARHQRLMNLANLEMLKKIERSKRDVIAVTGLFKVDRTDVSGLAEKDLKAGYGSGGGFSGTRGAAPEMRIPMPGMRIPIGPPGVGGMRPGPQAPQGMPVQGSRMPGEMPTMGAVPLGPAESGFFLYLEGTTPKRGMDATLFLKDLKNALIEAARDFPDYEVVLGNPIRIDPGRDTTATEGTSPRPAMGLRSGMRMSPRYGPMEALRPAGTDGLDRQDEHIVPDPLTGEDASGDTRFVVGWIFRFKGPKPQAQPTPGLAPGMPSGPGPGAAPRPAPRPAPGPSVLPSPTRGRDGGER